MSQVPNFSRIPLTETGPASETAPGPEGAPYPEGTAQRWASAVLDNTGKDADALEWEAPEGIAIKPLYTGEDTAELDFLDEGIPGLNFLTTYPGKVRYAEDFEQLRDAADEQLAETGSRPQVFLATLGPLATHTARASFAKNLFAAGGLDCREAGVTESAQDVLDAYSEVDTPVVCLCSSDKTYDERAEETARALEQTGAKHVLLAGPPSNTPPEGVDGVVFDGCDALTVLRDIHARLGVRK